MRYVLGPLLIILFASSCVEVAKKSGALGINDQFLPGKKTISNMEGFNAFKRTVYPLVRSQTCVSCHGADQSPKFAVSDPLEAYYELKYSKKVDLDSPIDSRIVKKIKDQSHNCWTSDCDADSSKMLAEVIKWAAFETKSVGAQFETNALPFPSTQNIQLPQTEHGTLVLNAEQSAPGVVQGRFTEDIDNLAIGKKYIKTLLAPKHPYSDSERLATIHLTDGGGSACRQVTDLELQDTINGPFRLSESRLFLSSESRINMNGDTIRDGFRPFSVDLLATLVRPDRRLEYAKMLLSGDYSLVDEALVLTGNGTIGYQEEVDLEEGIPHPKLLGGKVAFRVSKVLPHFISEAEFTSGDPGLMVDTVDGGQIELYKIFEAGGFDASNDEIRKFLRSKKSEYLNQVLYKELKNTLVSGINYGPAINLFIQNDFLKVFRKDNDYEDFFALKTEVKLACPFSPAEKNVFIEPDCEATGGAISGSCTVGKRNKGRKNCNPAAGGNASHLTFLVTSNIATEEKLTYANAMDKLTVSGNQIVPYTGSGEDFFHRIELYVNFSIDVNSRYVSGLTGFSEESFRLKYYEGSANASYVPDEVFNLVDEEVFEFSSIPSNTKLDLAGVLMANGSTEAEDAVIENFGTTLYPVLRGSSCTTCHAGNTPNPSFAQENKVSAYQALKGGGYINFADPADSFRGRSNNMIHNCGGATDCANLRSDLLDAIQTWRNANNLANQQAGGDFRALTKAERTPGRLSYKFKAADSGYYNVWLRARDTQAEGGLIFRYQVLDNSGTPLRPYNKGMMQEDYCRSISSFENSWTWLTEGRSRERASIDSKGKILLDNDKNELDLINDRVYYYMNQGQEYTLEVIENTPGIEIDLVAIDFVSNNINTQTSATITQTEAKLDLLEFQPDIRQIDYKHISDYERRVLEYDISGILNTSDEVKFIVEVRRDFDGQNYTFRNPRFIYNGTRTSIYMKGIKVKISGRAAETDKTFADLSGYYGNGEVITYAPMITLNGSASSSDTFSFVFDELSLSDNSLTELSPKSETNIDATERKCEELDLFVKLVKPILKDATVSLNGGNVGFDSAIRDAPGRGAGGTRPTNSYKCMSCHDQNHPYFKMTTFEGNDEELCRQAISRVDFGNYYQSTIVRGINGSNGHPKFRFLEEIVYEGEVYNDSGDQIAPLGNINFTRYRVHDEANDYLKSFVKSGQSFFRDSGDNPKYYAKRIIPGPFEIYTPDEQGWNSGTNFSSLSPSEKVKARKLGNFKVPILMKIPTDTTQLSSYDPIFHGRYLGANRTSYDYVGAGKENLALTAYPSRMMRIKERDVNGNLVFVNGVQQYIDSVNPRLFPVYSNRRVGDAMYLDPKDSRQLSEMPISTNYLDGIGAGRIPIMVKLLKTTTGVPGLNNNQNSYVVDNDARFDLNSDGNFSELDDELTEMNMRYENARVRYREAVIRWIRAEAAARGL